MSTMCYSEWHNQSVLGAWIPYNEINTHIIKYICTIEK